MQTTDQKTMPSIAVLISGNGTNLQAIIDHAGEDYRVVQVISNVANVPGLQRAATANIPHHCIDHRAFSSRLLFDRALQTALLKTNPDLVVLAGFMRRLSDDFVHYFSGRLINIHPSLLPLYPGLRTHRQVIENKDKSHGCTIHFVTPAIDEGPIIAQSNCAISTPDDEYSISNKVKRLELDLYPRVIKLFAEKRITLIEEIVYLDDQPLGAQGLSKKQINSQKNP